MNLEQKIKKFLKTGLVIGSCLLGSLVYSNRAEALTIIEQQITTNALEQYSPDIHQDKIVWMDRRNGNPDIYMKDLATNNEIPISTNPSWQESPVIYGTKIVWADDQNGSYDIYMYDLGPDGIYGTADDIGEVRITTNGASQYNPKIYGTKIVWYDYRNFVGFFQADIYMYDLGLDGLFGTADDSGEIQITTNTDDQWNPSVYDTKVVWKDYKNGNWDIYMYDLGPDGIYGTADDIGEVQITTNPAHQGGNCCVGDYGPNIYGTRIVYEDWRNGNADIYMYDLGPDGIYGTADDSGEVQITTDTADQGNPAIHGNKIVWFDWRNGNGDIYMYDLGLDGLFGTADDSGEVQITTDTAGQGNPAVYLDKIVWSDWRNDPGDWSNLDIYMATIVEQQMPIKSIVPIAASGVIAGLGALVLGYRRRKNET